jgi:hypothetical protein
MANFSLRAALGSTVKDWTDQPGALPSRLNPVFGLPHRYLSVPRSTSVVIYCTVDGGAEAAADSTLGGNLFSAYWAEAPSLSVPAIISTAGYSSIIISRLDSPGHYLLQVARPFGGQQLMHLACE